MSVDRARVRINSKLKNNKYASNDTQMNRFSAISDMLRCSYLVSLSFDHARRE